MVSEPQVFASCKTCGVGAIYVPEVGPMGDEFCTTVEEAIATGQHWTWVDGEPMCPNCVALGEDRRALREAIAEDLRRPLPIPTVPQPHWTEQGSLAQRLEEAAVGWMIDSNLYLGARHRWRVLRAAALWEAAGRARGQA